MKAIAILISGGMVQGVYEVHNSPHSRVIIVDDDDLRNSGDRQSIALGQLNGYDFDGGIEYKEIHSELSNYISSDDVY